jgi:colicin import membrane protein
MDNKRLIALALVLAPVLAGWTGAASAKLPPPTAAEVEAKAAKKAVADAQAEKDKQLLLAKMDTLTAEWRGKAGAKGWKLNAPTPLPAPAAAVAAPGAQSAPSGQPDGKLTAAGAQAPIKSEKSNTAAPSADVKPAPSPPASTVKTR